MRSNYQSKKNHGNKIKEMSRMLLVPECTWISVIKVKKKKKKKKKTGV